MTTTQLREPTAADVQMIRSMIGTTEGRQALCGILSEDLVNHWVDFESVLQIADEQEQDFDAWLELYGQTDAPPAAEPPPAAVDPVAEQRQRARGRRSAQEHCRQNAEEEEIERPSTTTRRGRKLRGEHTTRRAAGKALFNEATKPARLAFIKPEHIRGKERGISKDRWRDELLRLPQYSRGVKSSTGTSLPYIIQLDLANGQPWWHTGLGCHEAAALHRILTDAAAGKADDLISDLAECLAAYDRKDWSQCDDIDDG